jgi:hypothetical protein
MDVNAVLGLIDGAINAWEVSGDAMRWTPEPVDEVDPVTGLRTGGVVRGGWFWDTIARHLPQMGRDLSRVLDETHVWTSDTTAVTFTLDNSEATFRRLYLNDAVPSGLSRATDHGSTERGTT